PATTPPAVELPVGSQADAEANQGEQFLKAGDINGAILSFRRSVNLAPQEISKRVLLVRAYLAARRNADAVSEVRRALTIASPQDRAGQLELTRLLAEAMTQSGDTTAARATYEEIIGAQPTAQWARLGLAELLEKQGKNDEAEALYRTVRQANAKDRDAALGLARVLAAKGDYEGALEQITASSEGDGEDGRRRRFETAVRLFDAGTSRVADLLTENREGYERGTLAREVFYKATAAQSARVTGLLSLLKAVPPPVDATEVVRKSYRQRIFAASLLSQGVASLMTQLETGDAAAGSQASVFLNEFRTEMNAVRRSEAGTAADETGAGTPLPAAISGDPLSL
ncbi:MAG TPA: tetratricopeptide repeat protein, partial [Armatimonadaceae bacterium]|nr:tetratricopeptide repeat protein [Armatimonadaceae bacterium]